MIATLPLRDRHGELSNANIYQVAPKHYVVQWKERLYKVGGKWGRFKDHDAANAFEKALARGEDPSGMLASQRVNDVERGLDERELRDLILKSLFPGELCSLLEGGNPSSSNGSNAVDFAAVEAACRAIPFNTDEFEIASAGRQAITLLELQRDFIHDLVENLPKDDWKKERASGLSDLTWTVREEITKCCADAATTIEFAREAKWIFKLEDYREKANRQAQTTVPQ